MLLEGESNTPGYARLLSEGGRTALFTGMSDQVIPLCQKGFRMAQKVGNLEVQAETNLTMALAQNLDDEMEKYKIMEDVAEMAKANGLLSTAARAHNNIGATMTQELIDLELAQWHFIQAVETNRKIGDIEGMVPPIVRRKLQEKFGYT